LSSILKAGNIFIDQNNVVQIKSDFKPLVLVEEPPITTDIYDEKFPEEPEKTPEQIIAEMLEDAYKESEKILQEANEQAQSILENARTEAEDMQATILAEAQAAAAELKQEHSEQGYQEGMAQATAEGDEIKAAAQATLNDALAEQAAMRAAVEPDAVNLIVNILDKLLGDAIIVNPDIIVALIRSGFAGTTISGHITIRVSEDDYPAAMTNREIIAAMAGGTAEIEIVKDSLLAPADCIIDTPFGGIDASLTPQFTELRESLIYLLENR